MMHLSRDKVLVVALHRQRPDQDAVVVRRLYEAIRAHGARLERSVRHASGEDVAARFLDTGIEGVRFFERSTAMLWGPYDLATFYLADDVVSILRIGSSCGASAHDLVLGQLFGTDEDNAPALRALLGRREGRSPLLVLFSRVKLNDAFLAVGGHLLRAAYARHVQALARAAALASGKEVLCLAMDTWSSHELAFILLGDDPMTLLRLSGRIEGASLEDVCGVMPQLRDSLLGSMTDPASGPTGDTVARSILRRWAVGRRERSDAAPQAILRAARTCHLALAARAQLGIHLPAAGTAPDAHGSKFPALAAAVRRCIDIMQPGSTIGEAPKHEDLLRDISLLRAEFAQEEAGPEGLTQEEAGPEGLAQAGAEAEEQPLNASIQWLPKPGHVRPVLSAVRDLADALSLLPNHVRLGTGGRTTSVSMNVEFSATEAGCMLLHAITLWLRVDPKLSGHIAGTLTAVEIPQHAAAVGFDDEEEEPHPPPSIPNSLPPEPRATADVSGLSNARGYLLFEYPRTEETTRFVWKRLQALGVGTAESLAIQSLFATIQDTLAQPEMFGALLDISNVCKELVLDLCHTEDLGKEDLFDDVRQLLHYTQQAYQQRLQFSAVVEGAPAIAGEVPYGISQLVEMASGVAAVILGLPRIALDGDERWRGRPRASIVLLSADAAVAMRGIRSFGVFNLSSAQAMTPMSLCPLFHELGHWMVRFWHSPEDLEKRKLDLHVFAGELSNRLRADDATGHKQWTEAERARHVDRTSTFLDDVLAHAAWRLLGCDGEMTLFHTEFLSTPAMGIRTGDPLQDFRGALDLWAVTALHLHVQERLADNGESLRQVLYDLAARAAGSAIGAAEWWEGTIKKSVYRVLPFAMAQIASAAGDDKIGEVALARALVNETTRQAELLGEISLSDDAHVKVLVDEPLAFFVHCQQLLRAAEQELTVEWPQYSRLRDAAAKGELLDAPPWSLLDADGEPSLKAFLWVRSILSGVADHFGEECRERKHHGVFRDAYNRTQPGTTNEGIFADFLGGLYRVGREARTRCLTVHATALHALEEVSYRVRAGRIDSYFRHQRSFPRLPADYPVTLIRDDREYYQCVALDISPVGLGLRLGDAAKQQIEGGALRPLVRGDAIDIRTPRGRLKAIVKWPEAPGPPDRLGLHVEEAEPLFDIHWARSPAT
jgi:hypothetical protein